MSSHFLQACVRNMLPFWTDSVQHHPSTAAIRVSWSQLRARGQLPVLLTAGNSKTLQAFRGHAHFTFRGHAQFSRIRTWCALLQLQTNKQRYDDHSMCRCKWPTGLSWRQLMLRGAQPSQRACKQALTLLWLQWNQVCQSATVAGRS